MAPLGLWGGGQGQPKVFVHKLIFFFNIFYGSCSSVVKLSSNQKVEVFFLALAKILQKLLFKSVKCSMLTLKKELMGVKLSGISRKELANFS